MSIKLNTLSSQYNNYFDTLVEVNGWIQTIRTQKDIKFIKLNDGSNASGVQLIVDSTIEEKPENIDDLNIGASINVIGLLVKSPAVGQPFEILVKKLVIYGLALNSSYPLSKGKLPLDYLRNYSHLRNRTQTFGSVFRIKSAISHATNNFFQNNGFLHINPNIITVNECEGGAGVFTVTEYDLQDHSKLPKIPTTNNHDWQRDHFSRPSYLTVSSQLQLEAIACSLGSVYTTNKSFRSEHSGTNKHLSEFEHLEIEDVFITLDNLMDIAELYIKSIGNYLLENCMEDIENLGKFISKGLLDRINKICSAKFTKITYNDAIDILSKATELSTPIVYGEDLCSEFEHYLAKYFNGPVFVSHWPLTIKSFYMKQSETNPELCDSFDLLMPYKVGELIGGSMREDNLDKLLDTMQKKGVNPDPLQFYLDLRRFGTVPHGGFGLGLDRLCMLFTGMESIKDVVAFPVCYKSCSY